jgi:putative ABC transport system permease protein
MNSAGSQPATSPSERRPRASGITIAGFVLNNALRNGRSALLTVLSVAMSCALLVTLLTLQRELTVPPESEAASFRIIARNKVSLAQPLPARQRTIIEKIPGLRQVSPFTYFGGLFRDETTTSWAQFAVDPARFRELILEGKINNGGVGSRRSRRCRLDEFEGVPKIHSI